MRWLLFKLPLRIVAFTVIGFFVWQAVVFLRPRPADFVPAGVKALDVAFNQFIHGIVTEKDKINESDRSTPFKVGVAHLINDPRDTATATLRARLRAHPRFDVHEGSVLKKFFADITTAIAEATSLEEIIQAGQRVDLDLVLAGRIIEVTSFDANRAAAKVELMAWDTHRGTLLLRQTVQGQWEPHWSRRFEHQLRSRPFYQRLLLWLCLVLAMPWITAFATHRVLERKNNAISFALIMSYTLFGTALAIMLNATEAGAPGFWWQTLLALVAAALYSFWACEAIARRAR